MVGLTGICQSNLTSASASVGGGEMIRRTPKRGSAIAFVVALFLLGIECASGAEKNVFDPGQFDPSRCKHDPGGKLYIALGRYVLARPPGATLLFGPIKPHSAGWLSPPDPNQPEGCLDNPAQMKSYEVGNFATSEYPDLRAIRLTLFALSASDATPWPGEVSELTRADHACRMAAIRETLGNGLEACRIMPKRKTRVENWAASYVAPSEIYKTPTGRRFVINCDPELYSDTIGDCIVTYSFSPRFGVSYRFKPFAKYPGGMHIPIDKILEFDHALRAKIDALRVKNYAWPTDPQNGKK